MTKTEIEVIRQKLAMDVEYVLISARKFNDAVIKSLGDLSREEVIDAIVKFFADEMEKLK